jgi:hypothetical protein
MLLIEKSAKAQFMHRFRPKEQPFRASTVCQIPANCWKTVLGGKPFDHRAEAAVLMKLRLGPLPHKCGVPLGPHCTRAPMADVPYFYARRRSAE